MRTGKSRDVYKKYYGSIPIDPDGRTYEIHHIDGIVNKSCLPGEEPIGFVRGRIV